MHQVRCTTQQQGSMMIMNDNIEAHHRMKKKYRTGEKTTPRERYTRPAVQAGSTSRASTCTNASADLVWADKRSPPPRAPRRACAIRTRASPFSVFTSFCLLLCLSPLTGQPPRCRIPRPLAAQTRTRLPAFHPKRQQQNQPRQLSTMVTQRLV